MNLIMQLEDNQVAISFTMIIIILSIIAIIK